jgi:hypothetical protein
LKLSIASSLGRYPRGKAEPIITSPTATIERVSLVGERARGALDREGARVSRWTGIRVGLICP